MYLDYSKLEFDANGLPEVPELMLQTLHGKNIGILPSISDLKFNIKLSEPSEISFTISSVIGDELKPNTMYSKVVGHKLVYTKQYGVYVLMNPSIDSDGISETKTVQGYSIEKRLETKKFFLEEGTFNFWNPASPDDTVLQRIVEVAPGWSVGYVSPSLVGRYRTFDQYDDYLLQFVYNTAPEMYRCFFVFEPYNKTINVYDADEERVNLPIYLDFDNLVETVGVSEISDELVTAIRPYGADELSIYDINPIGTNWMYDLSYFISNGDIPSSLAEKWESWQRSIHTNQSRYEGLIGLRSTATARKLMEQTVLTELKGEKDDLINQQSVQIQALAMETEDEGKATQQAKLDEINEKLSKKNEGISAQEELIKSIEDDIVSYNEQIQLIVDELAIDKYFTEAEYSILCEYFIEQDIVDDTFIATTISNTTPGTIMDMSTCEVLASDCKIVEVDLSDDLGKRMFTITGGILDILGGSGEVTADIIRGNLEVSENSNFILSFYNGKIEAGDVEASSGMITLTGKLSDLSTDIESVTAEDGITDLIGTYLGFSVSNGSMYLTTNISDYQKYSVELELYDHMAGVLKDLAVPTYEFSVDAGNFLFAQEFERFRKSLELGKGVYLRIGKDEVITPYIIEFELDFENISEFSLVFSNRFKRHDNVNTLKDMIETSYSSSRSFDASKYIYNQTASQASVVSKFMTDSLDTAVNNIIGASNQSVLINGSGIHVGGDSNYQLRIVDNMIAMTDDGWETSKLAIGLFASPDVGEYWGVNADVIGGKLLIGNNLVIENTNDQGVMQFKVDSTGAWLYNSTMVLQNDASQSGAIIIDPLYGIMSGDFVTDGTTITPSFIEDGEIQFDEDGIPVGATFYVDSNTGNAYFRGTMSATKGTIGGWNLAEDKLWSGDDKTYVGLSSSGNDNYAIWAGDETPTNAPFSVDRNGNLKADNGTFGGTLEAAKVSGALTASDEGGWLEGVGIRVGENASATNGYNFYVDTSGNLNLEGSINLSNGSITWGSNNPASGKISASQCRTIITSELVSSPNIAGAQYWNLDQTTWLEVGKDANGIDNDAYGLSLFNKSVGDDSFFSVYKGDPGYTSLSGPNHFTFLTIISDTVNNVVETRGTWDFSGADVDGITARFG